MKTSNKLVDTPYKTEQRKELQDKLTTYYQRLLEQAVTEEDKEKLASTKLTQEKLAKELHMAQPAISRILKGYQINWDTWTIEKKTSETELDKLLKGTTIIKPSTFFITVAMNKRKLLKESLLLYFPATKNKRGILHIIELSQPSGLLIFSNDHNLEYHLSDAKYLQKLITNSNIQQ